jgi:hypothetical protein
MAKTYSELQTWKRQLVKADNQLRGFEASTQREMDACCMLADIATCMRAHPINACLRLYVCSAMQS